MNERDDESDRYVINENVFTSKVRYIMLKRKNASHALSLIVRAVWQNKEVINQVRKSCLTSLR